MTDCDRSPTWPRVVTAAARAGRVGTGAPSRVRAGGGATAGCRLARADVAFVAVGTGTAAPA